MVVLPNFNMGELIFSGLDVAKRHDLSAFVALKYTNGVLEQVGQKTWLRVNYKQVADDVLDIQRNLRSAKVCFDRTGVGDAAIELFSKEIPMEEVISSAPTKLAIINLIHALFNHNRLIIHDKDLYKQVVEQEKHISDAGNELYRHPSGRHDDIFWALGYACYAAREYVGGLMKTAIAHGRKVYSKSTDDRINDDIEKQFGTGWNIRSR